VSDFSDLIATPQGAQAWGQIQDQLTAEGADSVSVLAAQDTLGNTWNTLLSNNFGIDPDTALSSAATYTMAASTISGSIKTVSGLVSAAENASTPEEVGQVFNLFAGTMVGVATALGAVSAGVGAVIVAAVGIAVDIIESFLGSAPGVEVCPGVNCNPTPQWVVNCNCFWGNVASPGSTGWRRFPTASNWFVLGGSAIVTDAITGAINATIDGSQPLASPSSIFTSTEATTSRPIDVLFPEYAQIEAPAPPGLGDFHSAFFSAWKANQEYALNGLKPQDDTTVLLHVIRIWNRSHSPSSTFNLSSSTAMYEGTLVDEALYSNDLTSDLDSYINGTSLIVYIGPQLSFPVASAGALGPAMATGTKVALSVAIVSGAASLGVGTWAFVTKQGYTEAWSRVWDRTGGSLLRKR
jgi:hypothetical protein